MSEDFTLTREEKQLLLDRRAAQEDGEADETGSAAAAKKPMSAEDVQKVIKDAAAATAKSIEADRRKADFERQREDQRTIARQTVSSRVKADPHFGPVIDDSPGVMRSIETEIGDALEADKEAVAKLSQDEWTKRLQEETDKAMAKIRKEATKVAGLSDEEAAERLKGRSTGTGGSGTGKATGGGDNTARAGEPEEIEYGSRDLNMVYPDATEIEKRHQNRLKARDARLKAGAI